MANPLVLSVHEFMTIMGTLDEALEGKGDDAKSIVYDSWYVQWRDVDDKLEKMPLMKRADMLFDGKLTIADVDKVMLSELLVIVGNLIKENKDMVDEGNMDADEEELEMWQQRMESLNDMKSDIMAKEL